MKIQNQKDLIEEMLNLLEEKLLIYKEIARYQLKLLNAYDLSISSYKMLIDTKEYEYLEQQQLDIDILFLSAYQNFLEFSNVKKINEIPLKELKEFKSVQEKIKVIEDLMYHIDIQRQLLLEIESKYKFKEVGNYKSLKAQECYKKNTK